MCGEGKNKFNSNFGVENEIVWCLSKYDIE
jgi:hypothetical protein